MSVFISNLDDFIAPGQACVNPLVNKVATQTEKTSASKITLETDFSTTEFEMKQEPNLIRSRDAQQTQGKVATISLNDCLACSGCVTTAEAVLVQQQSYDRLLEKLAENDNEGENETMIVVAISPQSRCSIAEKLNITQSEAFLRISTILKSLGCKYILDSSSAGDVSLIEASEEFIYRIKNSSHNHNNQYRRGNVNNSWISPRTTTAISSTAINIYGKNTNINNDNDNDDVEYMSQSSLIITNKEIIKTPLKSPYAPMIISSCPGWICYAEKTIPEIIPYISTTKSSQQILGSIFKKYFSPTSNSKSMSKKDSVYIVSVQPCFDKKLEASRLDFRDIDDDNDNGDDKSEGVQNIDLVISTNELWLLLEHEAQAQAQAQSEEKEQGKIQTHTQTKTKEEILIEYINNTIPDSPSGSDEIESMFRSFSSDGNNLVMASDSEEQGSGGYMEYILKYASKQILNINLDSNGNVNAPLEFEQGRNSDIAHCTINAAATASSSDSIDGNGGNDGNDGNGGNCGSIQSLTVAKVYGFRNIQSTMLKLKRNNNNNNNIAMKYDLIEVMACPSGCINGGGQLRANDNETSNDIKERINRVNHLYHHSNDMTVRSPLDSPLVKYIYSKEIEGRLNGGPYSDDSMALLHTRYHAVPKLEEIAPLASKW